MRLTKLYLPMDCFLLMSASLANSFEFSGTIAGHSSTPIEVKTIIMHTFKPRKLTMHHCTYGSIIYLNSNHQALSTVSTVHVHLADNAAHKDYHIIIIVLQIHGQRGYI